MKGSGKTTVGTLLAETLRVPFIDSDTEIELIHQRERGETLSSTQILHRYGQTYFHALETRALKHVAREIENTDFIFACGGRTPLQEENRAILSRLGTILFLNVDRGVLLKRIIAQDIPPFFPYQDDPERSLNELLAERLPTYKKLAQRTFNAAAGSADGVALSILKEIRSDDQH